MDSDKDDEAKLLDEKNQTAQIKKSALRTAVINYGEMAVCNVAQNLNNEHTQKVPAAEQKEIRENFQYLLEKEDLSKCTGGELLAAVAPHSLLERFAAKKSVGMSQCKDFLTIKGAKGQIENATVKVTHQNEQIRFKCLHYSVTESSGHIDITVVKVKDNDEFSFGIRTDPNVGSGEEANLKAKAGTDYISIDTIFEFKASDKEKVIQIEIIDNNDW